MIQKNWDTNSIKDQLQLKAIKERRPLSCIFELTYRCNFNCRMCYVHMSDSQASKYGRMRTLDEWLDMANQIREAGVLYLTLSGGECTQYPHFIELYEKLAQMGFLLTVMSNAGSYSDEIRDLFRKYPPHNAAITLYGGSNETYFAVTGDKHGFDKTVENIRFFRSLGIPVNLTFTMIKQNVRDYPLVGQLCSDLNLPFVLITDINAHRFDSGFSEALSCRLSPAERACVACRPSSEVSIALEEAKELEKKLDGFRIEDYQESDSADDKDYCIGSYSACAISWNGNMNTCISLLGMKGADPFEIGFEAAWEQLKANQASVFKLPDICSRCSLRSDCTRNCAGRRLEGTGSIDEPDPYTCEYTYLLKTLKNQETLTAFPTSPECI